jgi:hypothetical protein
MTAPVKATTPEVRHEDFCLPRPGATAPRIESYFYYSDDEKSGRSSATHKVTRCQECGAASYQQIGA